MSEKRSGGDLSLPHLLFVLFLGLKLAGVIDWSWWFVFAPLIWLLFVGFCVGCLKSISEQLKAKAK